MNIDPAEFACLKAIILFKPGKNYNLPASRLSFSSNQVKITICLPQGYHSLQTR